jgi:hypothetical protein
MLPSWGMPPLPIPIPTVGGQPLQQIARWPTHPNARQLLVGWFVHPTRMPPTPNPQIFARWQANVITPTKFIGLIYKYMQGHLLLLDLKNHLQPTWFRV